MCLNNKEQAYLASYACPSKVMNQCMSSIQVSESSEVALPIHPEGYDALVGKPAPTELLSIYLQPRTVLIIILSLFKTVDQRKLIEKATHDVTDVDSNAFATPFTPSNYTSKCLVIPALSRP